MKVSIAVALSVAALILVAAPLAAQDLSPDVAAKINGEVISTQEVADRTMQLYGLRELKTLIYYRLVAQEAEREGVVVTDQQVEAEIDRIRKRTGNRFDQYVANLGLTEKLLPAQIRHELYIRELLGKDVDVTEEEIETFYKAEENQSRFHKPETVRFRQIVCESKDRADAALKALKGGTDFPDVVQQYSVDEISRRLDGDIGFDLPRGALKAEWKPLEDAAFAMAMSTLSQPIAVGDKWVIIEVTAKRAKTDVTLAQAHDDIRDEIFKTKLDAAARDWLTDLFDKSSKEINRSLWE